LTGLVIRTPWPFPYDYERKLDALLAKRRRQYRAVYRRPLQTRLEHPMTIPTNSDDIVLVERRAGVATITLNRPDTRNAFNAALRSRVLAVLREIATFDDVRVVILSGAGRGFSSGADLKAGITSGSVRMELLQEYAPILLALRRMDVVVLAAVNGAAAGIGAAVVAAADLAIMADDASIQLAFSKLALVPDGGLTWELVRALGYKRAYRLMIEGGKLDAHQCRDFGLVNEIVPAARLMEEAHAWAERLCQLSPTCNALTKRALHQAQHCTFEEAICHEADLQEVAGGSKDCAEGVDAFLNKRPAKFTGR
jgi:2-(1,2-epoxy-1,2-dihydrophenyl)acetyl-CoA isomerase